MATPGPMSVVPHHGIVRIISGGQTGVDRAALDVAIQLGIAHGGWCPKGRRSEDGRISERYRLTETESSDYVERTEKNVMVSDGTLLLYRQRLTRGSLLTHQLAKGHAKPVLKVRLDRTVALKRIVSWITQNNIRILNVAGPRASSHPGIEQQAFALLTKLFHATPNLPGAIPRDPSTGQSDHPTHLA